MSTLERLQACVNQMEQCEKMFRDDEDFMEALSAARAELSDPGRVPRTAPRFRVVVDTLTDGSQVGAIIFRCDYDPENLVQIDCDTVDKAQELCAQLNEHTTDIVVTS